MCEDVRRETVRAALRAWTNPDAFTEMMLFRAYARHVSNLIGVWRLVCGCRVCLPDRPPEVEDPESQPFVKGQYRLFPYRERLLSCPEIEVVARLTLDGLTAGGARSDRKPGQNLADLVGHFEARNEAARLTSEASLRHYAGEFAAQAGVERELDQVLGRLHDQTAPFARCENKALEAIHDRTPVTRQTMLAGPAVIPVTVLYHLSVTSLQDFDINNTPFKSPTAR